MLNLEQVTKQDRLLRVLTGMNRKAFERLLLIYSQKFTSNVENRNLEKGRQVEVEKLFSRLIRQNYFSSKKYQIENPKGVIALDPGDLLK